LKDKQGHRNNRKRKRRKHNYVIFLEKKNNL